MMVIPAGLYIHVPFCLSKCFYCSFYSIKSTNLIPDYLLALQKEIEFYSKHFHSLDTIYLGGGTPSLLSYDQLAGILSAIHNNYRIAAKAEITIEANPGDISPAYLRGLRKLGINRLNIGIQSFDNKLLKFLGRRHSSLEAISAIEKSRRAGFDNLGIDLIYGIQGTNIKSWKNTLQKAVSFAPEHISCYQLSLDHKTPLYRTYGQNGFSLPDENTQANFFMTTSGLLEAAGYIHYEVSNFARGKFFQSQHNGKYWRHSPYLGLGPGAHSFLDSKRWWNKSSVRAYLKEIGEGRRPVEYSEELTLEQLQLEALFMGLRTSAGINLRLFKRNYDMDLLAEKKTILEKLRENGLVKLERGFLLPTRRGLAVADSLALI
ncbi:MAG: coproporphyrinogen III oxidase [Deltaproteobacteria bacterium HGW-Deltaproteobacteria-12]|jgi:oxygen-independent coproporphyrinogen-3 oxidase|nr:MAG: coproporphyrinogen III oxidase [Deltaproteobacteria bacterium HGW-Deltaproteobacteria-12]